MKTKKTLFVFIFVLGGLLTSCEQVIQVDLQEAQPTLVVDGRVTDSLPPFIRLTTTKNFFSTDPAPAVTNAFVTLSDNQGLTDTLQYLDKGIYQTSKITTGVPGRIYSLLIKYNNKVYTATEPLYPAQKIDSISYKFVSGNPLQKKGYYLTMHAGPFLKPQSFFQLIVLKNDTQQVFPFKYLTNDDHFFVPGKPIQLSLPYTFQKNDLAKITYLSISKQYFKYLFNLNNQLNSNGGPFDAQPANLPTNITGGAFGFFEVAGISRQKVRIK